MQAVRISSSVGGCFCNWQSLQSGRSLPIQPALDHNQDRLLSVGVEERFSYTAAAALDRKASASRGGGPVKREKGRRCNRASPPRLSGFFSRREASRFCAKEKTTSSWSERDGVVRSVVLSSRSCSRLPRSSPANGRPGCRSLSFRRTYSLAVPAVYALLADTSSIGQTGRGANGIGIGIGTSVAAMGTGRRGRAEMSTEDDTVDAIPVATALESLQTVVGENGAGKSKIETIAQDALVWAALNGLVVGDGSLKESGNVAMSMVHVPLTLLPSPFPLAAFEEAIAVAPLFNDLVDCISQDAEFLQTTLASASRADPFTTRLLEMHSKILEEGITQDIRLGIHRSDYMLDHPSSRLLQVELNTISASFAGLSTQVGKLHKYLLEKDGASLQLRASAVPENGAADMLAEGLAAAWKEYGDDSAVVMTVVQPNERNMYDQHWITQKLWESHGVHSIRRTLKEISAGARIDANGSFVIDDQVVSVVYFRAGYTPTDYPSEAEWDARLLIERSTAVKCPSISYHLTGAKKIQQEIARPGVLERVWGNSESAASLRRFFAGLWGLEGEGSEEIIERALADPDRFVLKPQREGGGNNVYGDDVRKKLISLRDTDGGCELGAYILMERIEPVIRKSYLLRRGQWSLQDTVSELGVFSTYLRNGDRVVLNKPAGHLLRTKAASSDEGGVAAGFAVLDSPYLIS